MTEIEYSRASEATTLCKACGLCCSGHLFSWVRLKATELNRLEKLGVEVIRSDPRQRGFLQPCPLWNGQCTIYDSLDYPSGCSAYNCKLLRELLDESISITNALRVVEQAKEKIRTVENRLPPSKQISFREQVVEQNERLNTAPKLSTAEQELQSKIAELLSFFDKRFGVHDFLEMPQVTDSPRPVC